MNPSIFYNDPIYIVLSIIQFKMSQEWNYTLTSPFYKITKFIGYKYTMNLSNSRFMISSFWTLLAYVFSESISLNYHCTFSLYKVTDLNIWKSLYPLNEIFCKHQLPVTLIDQTPLTTNHLNFSYQVIRYLI